ncbi:lysine--tRNA ligase [Roseospira marina]|uniref:Lysine--tRNA ligase n=1 Tax=Roseospira marina TaxID=140057 RepID=A0A5M6IG38_9PROT|nr:lysine--tRNA ligase [Roseospira marina]KAA5606729.1 lysine--tRNA ligase [Roseospira marina]MBB4313855.1 lysyl-tRNA synthetase class 1 [Roseospira marina]MBB5087017.1 lysyl-tRNA synthetase class 1 [Roseospira marina]
MSASSVTASPSVSDPASVDDLRAAARESNAWPFQEARTLLNERLKGQVPDKGYVLFETGYGPSGLPHIGTFGEVVRTTMVRRAFQLLAPHIPTRLFAFSDDMDGLRKVPDNIPNKAMVAEHLGKPLTRIPDPFGTHESFGHHNNARLRAFLDSFGFEYEFQSATECYTSGRLDAALLTVLRHYDAVRDVVLPTLGDERRATYSPFLPVCPKTGQVLQVPVLETNPDAGTIVYEDVDGRRVETPVTGGRCKLQWKADWGTRWYALGVDYEMSGKDLIDSVRLSSRICRILGGEPPVTLTYELFLDDKGQKISKSKGNGLAVEDWLKYANAESLALFMYQKPRAAKKLYFDVIPRNVDDYLTYLEKFPAQAPKDRLNNPVWHIHDGAPPREVAHLSFGILLNLASVCHSEDPAVLWHYIGRYAPGASPETAPILNGLVHHAIAYYRDFVLPNRQYRSAEAAEAKALEELRASLAEVPADADAEALQTVVYEVGKAHTETFGDLKGWFKALYQILLGQDQGPRMGSFIALFGRAETLALLDRAIAGEDLAP